MENKPAKQDTTSAKLWSKQGKSYWDSIRVIEDAVKAESKPLAMLRLEHGNEVVESAIVTLTGDAVLFFSVGKSMNNAQLKETAKIILSQYYFLKLEDFKLFFLKFKRGEYGQLFDRIDGQVIMLALEKYCEERIAVAERMSMEKHKEILARENETFYLVKIGLNWLRSAGDYFEEVELKELATTYTFGVAMKLKAWLTKEHYPNPEHIKIWDSRKGGSLFDYLEKNAPQLLPKGEKFKRSTNEYYTMKTKINADETLTPFQKENAIRRLANLEPVSETEFEISRKAQEDYYTQNK